MELSIYKKGHKTFDVNEIKKNLLSRKIENKISAAKRLFRFLMKNRVGESHVLLINADVVEMLCEASCTTNITLLKYIFKCISVFIESVQFFQQNHTAYTMESIIRALYVLQKTQSSENVLILGLELISDIISKLHTQNIAINTICSVQNIIHLLIKILTPENSKPNIYACAEVIISLLQSQGIQKFKQIIEDTVLESLKVLVDIAKKYRDKKCIIIISALVNGSIRFLIHPKVEDTPESSSYSLFIELVSIMKTILVPFLVQESVEKSNLNDLGLEQIILSALLSIYHLPQEPATKEFSHFLASKGFIDFLPSLEIQRNNSNTEFIIITRSLLFELLQCLSNNILGKENWRNLLLPGFEALPNETSYMSTILFQQMNHVIPIASIVYSYFYLLSSSNPNITPEYFLCLCNYILSLACVPSASVTKALWFSFAVAYLNKEEPSHYSKIALYKLINFIKHYNIAEVYTHHPAILYWAFSDEFVPNELQTEIIRQWLDDNDDGSIKDLKLLLTVNKESCFVIMGLMAYDNKSSLVIHKILTSIILDSNGKAGYIFDYAWVILPYYLAQFSSHFETLKYECLANVMKFCRVSKPKHSDTSQVLRISCLLPGAFLKYFKMSFSPNVEGKLTVDDNNSGVLQSTFDLVDNLINISLRFNDTRVPAIYLNHDSFLNAIELLLSSDCDVTNTSLMKLLMSLSKCQKMTNHKSSKTVHLDLTRLIQFVSRQQELCIATLKFLSLYLEIKIDKEPAPLVDISFHDQLKLRALYVQIQMVCAKADYEASVFCWVCLKKLLELSDDIGLRAHLSSIPYISALLSISVDTGSWKEAASFITAWIPSLPKHSSRSLATPNYIAALTNFIEKLKKMSKDQNIINALLKTINYPMDEIKEEQI